MANATMTPAAMVAFLHTVVGLDWAEIARLAGVHRSTIARIARGTPPRLNLRYRLLELYRENRKACIRSNTPSRQTGAIHKESNHD